MKSQSFAPRGSVSLPTRTESAGAATPGTRSLADVVADLDLGNEQRLLNFIERIEEINYYEGPDTMGSDIAKLIEDIALEPPEHITTLLLHLITKLDEWACSSIPNISEIALKRLPECLGLFEACSEYGAPRLEELAEAYLRRTYDTPPQDLLDYRLELHTQLQKMAEPIIETRLAAIGLPSQHAGSDLEKGFEEMPTSAEEEECTPWLWEVCNIAQALEEFDLPDSSLSTKLEDLVLQAEAGLESRSKAYDLAYLIYVQSDIRAS